MLVHNALGNILHESSEQGKHWPHGSDLIVFAVVLLGLDAKRTEQLIQSAFSMRSSGQVIPEAVAKLLSFFIVSSFFLTVSSLLELLMKLSILVCVSSMGPKSNPK